jgi:hypothetical protein
MRDYSLLKNLFYPSRKLLNKVVIGSYTKNMFDEPKTPYQRVFEHSAVSDTAKEKLRIIYNSLNPLVFKKKIFSQLRQLLIHASVTTQFEASDRPFGNIII